VSESDTSKPVIEEIGLTSAADPAPTLDMSPEAVRARRGRNIAIAVGLGVFVVLVFIVTLVRLKGNVGQDLF
jgi:hypothetical protein